MKYKLVCFDLDGTLIEDENGDNVWNRIISRIPNGNKIQADRFKLYNQNKLDYKEWAELDLNDWKTNNITKSIIIEEIKKTKLVNGAKETLTYLKSKGIKLAVISGSLSLVLDIIFPDHPFDDVFISEIFFNDEIISHWKLSDFADNGTKELALKEIAQRENIDITETVFVGDHLNDITAAKTAGLSIAFNSKTQELNEVCDYVIEKKDLTEIIKILKI